MPRRPQEEIYCDSCEKEIEAGRDRKPCCGLCRNKRRNIKKAREREAKGLPEWGTATALYRIKQLEDRKQARKDARKALGLPEYGSGDRNPKCSVCGVIKDNKDSGYCNSCKRDAAAQRRLLLKESPAFVENERGRRRRRYKESEFHRLKIAAQSLTSKAIRKGTLIKEPCEVCGKLKVDAHHDDYEKPLDVRWLCRSHHREHHEDDSRKRKEKLLSEGKENESREEAFKREEFEKFKTALNIFTYRMIKAGNIIKQPCEVCGKLRVDAHRDDYTKLEDIRWFCRHHRDEHIAKTDKTENQDGTTT